MSSWCVRVIGAVAIGSVVGIAGSASAGGPGENAQAPANRAGVRAYIDPQTGELGIPPAGAVAPSIEGTARRRPANLVEVPSTGSAGGFMVNTKGRFAADVVATTNGADTTHVQCAPHGPSESPRVSPK